MNGKCLAECVIYKATVAQKQRRKKKSYSGLTQNALKTRYNLHKSPFTLEHKWSSTTLSEHVCDLKKNIEHTIRWEILKKAKQFMPVKKFCSLCLKEKKEILTQLDPKNGNSHETQRVTENTKVAKYYY